MRRHRTAGRWAHPRSLGENTSAVRGNTSNTGSSPLTRGKLHPHRWQHRRRRLIPAHAGKTRRSRSAHPARPAHPRSRGENAPRASLVVLYPGSSPLTRGKTSPRNCGRGVGRFIPTDRGKLICIDEVHVADWKAPECTGATSPPHSTPARANHTQRSSTKYTCALMAEPMSSSRSRMPCPDQFH